jgi:hypothetical protein
MFSSWQTSLIGVAAIAVGGVLLYMGTISWTQFLEFLAIGGIGIKAADANKVQ